jgi:hypothetical protein
MELQRDRGNEFVFSDQNVVFSCYFVLLHLTSKISHPDRIEYITYSCSVFQVGLRSKI